MKALPWLACLYAILSFARAVRWTGLRSGLPPSSSSSFSSAPLTETLDAERLTGVLLKMRGLSSAERAQTCSSEKLQGFVDDMRALVTGEIEPRIVAQHASAQAIIDAAAQAFNTCRASRDSLDTHIATLGDAVLPRRDQHMACRVAEATSATTVTSCTGPTKEHMLDACRWTFMATDSIWPHDSAWSAGPSTVPPPLADVAAACHPIGNEDPLARIRRLKLWFDLKLEQYYEWEKDCDSAKAAYSEHSQVCEAASEQHLQQRAVCDSRQESLEAAVCAHAQARRQQCTVYHACHAGAKATYSAQRASIELQEATWKQEWHSARRALCLLELFEVHGCSADDSEVHACDTAGVDDGHLDVTYPPEEEDIPGGCDSSEPYPCTAEFLAAEYGALPSGAKATNCTPCAFGSAFGGEAEQATTSTTITTAAVITLPPTTTVTTTTVTTTTMTTTTTTTTITTTTITTTTTTTTPELPKIENGGFEDGSTSNDFEHTTTVPGWTVTGEHQPVFVFSESASWGGTAAEDGSYFLGLQQAGTTISQSIANQAGRSYELRFYVAKRSGYPDPTLKVWIGGQEMRSFVPESTSFSLATVPYTFTSPSLEVSFENASPEGDRTVFLDAITIGHIEQEELPFLANGGFEEGSLTIAFEYAIAVPAWSFPPGHEPVFIFSGNDAWGSTAAAEGSYFVGLQSVGSAIWQPGFSHREGTKYELLFYAAKRSGYEDPTLKVIVDGVELLSMVPASNSFMQVAVPYTATKSGAIEVKFENVSPAGDRTVFVDGVNIVEALQGPPLLNGDFEDGSSTGDYEYLTTVPGWTVAGGTGEAVFIYSGSPAWGGTGAADGLYFLGLQHSGVSISQSVDGHEVGASYELKFDVARRDGYPDPTLRVWVAGQVMSDFVPAGTAFAPATVSYVASEDTVQITFENLGPEGDRTVFIDKVTIERVLRPWSCYSYEAGQDDAWCQGAGVQDGFEYRFNGGVGNPCGGCWCCRRPTEVADGELQAEEPWSAPAPLEVNGGDWTSVICAPGEYLLGGGCNAKVHPFKMQMSGPETSHRWTCGGHGGAKQVWGLCSSIAPAPVLKELTGGDWTSVACDDGLHLIGGGCNAIEPPYYFQHSGPDVANNRWTCGGHGGSKQVWAICSSIITPTVREASGGDWTSAQCQAGELLLGGGCNAGSSPHYFQWSGPDGEAAYTCGGHGGDKQVWAICAVP